jgi:hypothetical protein
MYTFNVHVWAKIIQFIHKLNSFRIRIYIEWLNSIAFANACTHVHRMYKLNSFRIRMYIECINWIALAYTCTSNASIDELSHTHNLYIRCTCVCESYSIYTFDVHVYAKAIQFIHSMYMCMRKIFNWYTSIE